MTPSDPNGVAEGVDPGRVSGLPGAFGGSTLIGPARLYQGEAMEVLRRLEGGSVGALICDPPYSSGGFTRGDRIQDPAEKYVQQGTELVRASFTGDNRDGRSWCYWTALWLSECFRVVKDGGYAMVFCDWRQLPLATDALQAGGFVWRGIAAWDKGLGARAPHTGYLRHQCEYVVWGSRGPLESATHGGPWRGCFHVPVLQSDKHHMTGKPSELMRQLVEIVPPGETILDPFMGSGTTGVAAVQTGRGLVGVELDPHYFETAARRIRDAVAGSATSADGSTTQGGLAFDET